MTSIKNPVLLAGLICLSVFFSIPRATYASTVTFNFDTTISGTSPAGTLPWMTATLNDGGSSGLVTLTMSTSGLSGSENVNGVYFNLDPSLNVSSLNFTRVGSSTPAATVSMGTNSFKADGDGKYDILFDFPSGGGFGPSETVVYQISGISSLTAQSFNVLSACGNPSCSGPGNYYAAAQVQNINGGNSGWIASNIGVVPIPASAWLFGSGLLGLAGLARKSRARKIR